MDSSVPKIAVTCSNPQKGKPYVEMVSKYGANPVVMTPKESLSDLSSIDGFDGVLLSGGVDIHPKFYGCQPQPGSGSVYNQPLDDFEIKLTQHALDADMPVLAICRGMQILNVACGGELTQDLSGHREDSDRTDGIFDPATKSNFHRIFISPGSRLSATVGSGGFVRVNHRHHQGVKESQKSEYLMSSAWSMEDGLIESLESPTNDWVLGVQFHPERRGEIPPHFDKLFETLVFKASNTI